MTAATTLTRRAVLAALAGSAAIQPLAAGEALPKVIVHRDPSCDCCGGWVKHIREAGFPVEVIETTELNRVKARLKVPQTLAACHTAELGAYVIEGHIPAPAIKKLLGEKPQAIGLAVPGMPVGSPGMDAGGAPPETYDVVLFGPGVQRTFARYRGAHPI